MTLHVLVLCTHNAARSVLAEAMLNHLARRQGADVVAHSAGSAPRGQVHPLALAVLQDAGIDTQTLHSKSWDAFTGADAPPLSVVITVCDNAAAETCPVFIGAGGQAPVRVHWGYADPSLADGGDAGRRAAFERTRRAIGARMQQLLDLPLARLAPDRTALHDALHALGRPA